MSIVMDEQWKCITHNFGMDDEKICEDLGNGFVGNLIDMEALEEVVQRARNRK